MKGTFFVQNGLRKIIQLQSLFSWETEQRMMLFPVTWTSNAAVKTEQEHLQKQEGGQELRALKEALFIKSKLSHTCGSEHLQLDQTG